MMGNIYIYFTGIVIIGLLIYLLIKLFRKYSKAKPTVIDPFIFYDKVKNGYLTLFKSLYHNCNKKDLEEDLRNTLMQRTDGRYVGGYTKKSDEFDFISFSLDSFYDLLQLRDKREQSMILDLHKGVSLEKLNDFFINSLMGEVKDKSFINSIENASFPYTGTLSKYQKILNKSSIQIGYFTDDSDSYYLFIFPSSRENIIKKAIIDIGFEYQSILHKEASSLRAEAKLQKAFT